MNDDSSRNTFQELNNNNNFINQDNMLDVPLFPPLNTKQSKIEMEELITQKQKSLFQVDSMVAQIESKDGPSPFPNKDGSKDANKHTQKKRRSQDYQNNDNDQINSQDCKIELENSQDQVIATEQNMLQPAELFLFVNPQSGSKLGRGFLQHEYQIVQVQLDKQQVSARLYIIDLTDKEQKNKAMKDMVRLQKEGLEKKNDQKMYLIVAGGDGTLMYIVDDAIEGGLKIEHMDGVCMLPYGTANDLGRIMGWGQKPKPIWTRKMKTLIEEIINASGEIFNIWEIKVFLRETQESGLWQVSSSTHKKEPMVLKQNQYKRYMCNYFSLGVESRVGLGFDKRRTSNALCNKCVYFCEGIKKFMCCRGSKRTLKVKECVDYVATIDQDGNDKILFASSRNQECEKYLLGNPVSLVCTNINSIMGGQANLWEGGRDRQIGLVDAVQNRIDNKVMKFTDMVSHDDGMVEFEILSSIIHMSLNKSNRVAQEKGPITIHFKEPENNPLDTYFQIDGEYFKVRNPQRIEIQLSEKLKHFKLLKCQTSDT